MKSAAYFYCLHGFLSAALSHFVRSTRRHPEPHRPWCDQTHGCTCPSFPVLSCVWSSFFWSNSTTPAATPQTVKDPPDADQQSLASNRSSPSSAVAGTGAGRDGGTMSGGVRVASAVPELDKVDEFSAWTGINAAELGQVGARAVLSVRCCWCYRGHRYFN